MMTFLSIHLFAFFYFSILIFTFHSKNITFFLLPFFHRYLSFSTSFLFPSNIITYIICNLLCVIIWVYVVSFILSLPTQNHREKKQQREFCVRPTMDNGWKLIMSDGNTFIYTYMRK